MSITETFEASAGAAAACFRDAPKADRERFLARQNAIRANIREQEELIGRMKTKMEQVDV